MSRISERFWRQLFLATLASLTAACGPAAAAGPEANTIRVGYFANITHSQALIGLARGDFQQALGANVTIQATVFNAGPAAIEALFAGEIDLAYVGPNPAINGYVQSDGEALRVVAGATSGGAALIVRAAAGIRSAADLSGKRLASPQLGNTQDVALRNYLAANGLETVEQGGTVEVIPTPNAQILALFLQGNIDGAWVPEPWASQLIVQAAGTLFLDERDLWPGGDFVSANIIVSTRFLTNHPDLVKAWLTAHVAITLWELANPDEARALLNTEIEKLTGVKLDEEVLAQAWSRLRPTWDPITSSLFSSAQAAYGTGFLTEPPDLDGIYDLTLLNLVLDEQDLAEVH